MIKPATNKLNMGTVDPITMKKWKALKLHFANRVGRSLTNPELLETLVARVAKDEGIRVK